MAGLLLLQSLSKLKQLMYKAADFALCFLVTRTLIIVCNLAVSGINRSILGVRGVTNITGQQLESYNCSDL